MKLTVFAYSRRGCQTAQAIIRSICCDESQAFAPERFADLGFSPLPTHKKDLYADAFQWSDAIIFVGSCGIAVRNIAPYIKDKQTDPAVLAVDELGHFVIPLLSGHIGGANQLAARLAQKLSATPVITTATDINHRFSVDEWAAAKGFLIEDISTAKLISCAILEKDLPLACDFPIVSDLPSGIFNSSSGSLGIYIGFRKQTPFKKTLRLIPPILHLGLGCRRGTSAKQIEQAVHNMLTEYNLNEKAIKCAASIDLKSNEAGLLEYCKNQNIPVAFYSAERLSSVTGHFTSSSFVQSVTGVDNVCERAALLGADHLLVKKTASNGVTAAIAQENLEVHFG